MNCPVCGSENIKSNKCADCGADIIMIDKIKNISDILYNKGLLRASADDLTGASESLRRSLDFNKRNINARNLLGLIYFEVGEPVKAKKEWSLSLQAQSEDNPAKDYLDELERPTVQMQKIKESVRMYNQALQYLNQKSDDMAVIQLKKAIEQNPKFVSCMNLLALNYLNEDDKDNALKVLDKAILVDSGNPTTNRYRSLLNAPKVIQKPQKENKKAQKTTAKTYSPIADRRGFGASTVIAAGAALALGIVLGVAGIFITVIPGMAQEGEKALTEQYDIISDLTAKQKELETVNASTIADLEAAKSELEQKNNELQTKVSLQEKLQALTDASDMINDREYEQAARLLSSMDKEGLNEEQGAKLDNLMENAYPETARILFNRGLDDYRSGSYDEAAQAFNDCIKFADQTSLYAGDSYFYLGEIANNNDDIESAINYYTKLVDEYPTSSNRWTARNRLENLQ